MDNRDIMLNEIFTNTFDESKFNKFIIDLLNLDKEDRLTGRVIEENSGIYENHIEYVKDLGKYKDENRTTIVASIVKLKDSADKARTLQRNFIAKHLKDTGADAAIVALYSDNSDIWRISFVKLDTTFNINELTGNFEIKEDITPAKRYSYLVEPKLKNHTVQEQLRVLLFNDTKKPSVEEIENVFSVEVVTDEFFKMYKEKYLELKEFLEKNNEFKEESQRLMLDVNEFSEEFAKKLMGQVAFLYFLQKKGWLGVTIVPRKISRIELRDFYRNQNEETRSLIADVYKPKDDFMIIDSEKIKNLSDDKSELLASVFKNSKYDKKWGEGTKTFIRDIFEVCKTSNKNFFNEYLEPLFYNALNKRRGSNEYFQRFNCKIPFLNGGLFEPIYKYEWQNVSIEIPNEFFSNEEDNGLLDFFDMYNFTMNEDEPLEKEVAVDPEMLGKIFENLLDVKERKSKGAFYTPREIVHYMCQECLINYIHNETNIDTTSLELLIKYGDIIKDADLNIKDKNYYKMPKFIIDNLEIIDKALENVTVVDPAVGSGAFPLGMLNEIVKVRSILVEYMTKDLDEWGKEDFIRDNKKSLYDLKKNAMKKSIFAVDIEPSAVDITKLRLWLSLVVDADVRTINTLPNLDYNIMVGNSLIDEFEGVKLFDEEILKHLPDDIIESKEEKKQIPGQIDMTSQGIGIKEEAKILRKMQELQSEFFEIKDNEKKEKVRESIEEIEWELIGYKLARENKYKELKGIGKRKNEKRKPYFLWELEFSKVFEEKDGFDIVIGNPPYIKIQSIQNEEAKVLKKKYNSATGKFDIYVLFTEKAFELIKERGVISFIQPHRFLTVDYGKGIRKLLEGNRGMNRFINFGVNQVFDSATTYTGIFFFTNQNEYIEYTDAETSNLNLLSYNIKRYEDIGKQWIFKTGKEEFILNKIKNNKTNMLDIFKGVYQGIITTRDDIFLLTGRIDGDYFKGYSNALDQQVIIEKELVKPLLKGEHIRRYKKPNSDYFVFYAHIENEKGKTKPIEEEVLKEKYKHGYEYICNFKEDLIKIKEKYKTNSKYWYSMHRAREKYIFETEKIITPQLQNFPNFTLDKLGIESKGEFCYIGGYSLIKKSIIPDSLEYFIGILNSSVMWFFIKNTSTAFNNNYYYFKSAYLEPFSFPDDVDEDIKINIENLVKEVCKYYNNEIFEEDKIKCIEKKINTYVYKAYKFTDEEIEIIEKYNEKG